MVYIFRYFHNPKETWPHYVGAAIGFIGLFLHTSVWWPILLGLLLVAVLKLIKRDMNFLFWAEIVAGVPYIYYLVT